MNASPQKLLLIFVDATDTWREMPLYEAIVRELERQEVAGATVLEGVMGFGGHRKIHRKRLLGASDDKPIVILAVDSEVRLRKAMSAIREMIPEGLTVMLDAAVVQPGR